MCSREYTNQVPVDIACSKFCAFNWRDVAASTEVNVDKITAYVINIVV